MENEVQSDTEKLLAAWETRLMERMAQSPAASTPVIARSKGGSTPQDSRPKLSVSWPFVGFVVLIAWLGFFGGWEWLQTPATTTTIYQTATTGPGTGSRPMSTTRPSVLPPYVDHSSGQAPAVPTPAENGIAGNEATSQSMYLATVAAVNTQPVIVATPVPMGNVTQPSDRVLPTVAAPLNIQATQTCKHNQVWTVRGCRNPDGAQAERHP